MIKLSSLLLAFIVALSAILVGCDDRPYSAVDGKVEIRRTTDGIPHIKAADWFGAGYGYGYVQAEDALRTLAEAFVNYRASVHATWGRMLNHGMMPPSGVSAMIQEYRNKQWLRVPKLTEAEIASDPSVRRTVLRFRKAESG